MTVEISVTTEKDTLGVAPGLKKMITAASSLVSGNSTYDIINSTVCRAILQNDINIAFTNNWGANVYKGLMDSFTTATKTKTNTPLDVALAGLNVAKSAYSATSTLTNMGGMSMVGTGAGTTKIYGGSGISSFNISMKWYTPVDKTYKEALTALMILGFPSYRNAVKKSKGVDWGKGGDGALNKIKKILGGAFDTIIGVKNTLTTLLSFNPPAVKLAIYSGTTKIFNIYPLVITSINFHFSRETHNGIPVVIGADLTFELYQVLGNNGYANNDFLLAGVPIMGDLTKISQRNN